MLYLSTQLTKAPEPKRPVSSIILAMYIAHKSSMWFNREHSNEPVQFHVIAHLHVLVFKSTSPKWIYEAEVYILMSRFLLPLAIVFCSRKRSVTIWLLAASSLNTNIWGAVTCRHTNDMQIRCKWVETADIREIMLPCFSAHRLSKFIIIPYVAAIWSIGTCMYPTNDMEQ